MRIPKERTIVFAGAIARDFPYLEKAQVPAVMCSFEKIKGSKNLQTRLREGFSWNPITYIDSGVFTFMRRAGVTVQNKNSRTLKPATFEEFQAFAKEYISYLKTDAHLWDWIIEIDCAEIFGVEAEDRFRAGMRKLVGDKLLPVWHAQRGREGWSRMLDEYPYVCMALAKGAGGRTARNHAMVRDMVREAHAKGVRVHILGMSTLEHFETYEVDSMDSSSWASGVRWGEIKLNRGKVMVPKFDQKTRRPLEHNKMRLLADLIKQWGFSLEDVRTGYYQRLEVGVRMLMLRQAELTGGFADGSETLKAIS